MSEDRNIRRAWLARHILPHEPALRKRLRILGLPHDLEEEDVIHEAYAKLSSLQSVAHIRNPRNYFYQTARSIILSHVRRATVVPIHAAADLETIEDASNPEIEVSESQILERLTAAISELGEPHMSIFRLRIMEELPFRTIGIRLGMTGNAAQKNFTRSIAFLVNRIGHGENGDPTASKGMEEVDAVSRNV